MTKRPNSKFQGISKRSSGWSGQTCRTRGFCLSMRGTFCLNRGARQRVIHPGNSVTVRSPLAVEAAERFAELFDLSFRDVFFVLSFGELFADFVEVSEDALKGFADALDFGSGLENPGTLLGW